MSGSLPVRKPKLAFEKRLDLTQKLLRSTILPKTPPNGFDPIGASLEELKSYGLPPRPDKTKSPAQRATWERIMSKPLKLVPPTLRWVRRERIPLSQRATNTVTTTEDTTIYTTSTWSGAVISEANNFKFILGEWVVPNVYPGSVRTDGAKYYSAAWIGLDGWTSSDVLQGGTDHDVACAAGQFYRDPYAWYEWFPAYTIRIVNFPVGAGDTVACCIWTSTDGNNNTKGNFWIYNWNSQLYTAVTFDPPDNTTFTGDSAEWIMEDPSDGSLARFGTIPFSYCYAYGDDGWEDLSSADIINMSSSDGTECTAIKESDTVLIVFDPSTGSYIAPETKSTTVLHPPGRSDHQLEEESRFVISILGRSQVFTAEGNELRVREYTGNSNQIWICTRNQNNEWGFQNEQTGLFLGRDTYRHLACYAETQRGWECLTFNLSHGGYCLLVPIGDKKCSTQLDSDSGGMFMQVLETGDSDTRIGLHMLEPGVFRRFRWVEQSRLARSSAPNYNGTDDNTQSMTPEAVQYLVDHGIDNIISLNQYRLSQDEIDRLSARGIAYTHLPVIDRHAPTIDQLRQAHSSYTWAWRTLVYCGFGHGRTGTAIAALRIFGGQRFTHNQYHELFNVEESVQCDVLDELAKTLRDEL